MLIDLSCTRSVFSSIHCSQYTHNCCRMCKKWWMNCIQVSHVWISMLNSLNFLFYSIKMLIDVRKIWPYFPIHMEYLSFLIEFSSSCILCAAPFDSHRSKTCKKTRIPSVYPDPTKFIRYFLSLFFENSGGNQYNL